MTKEIELSPGIFIQHQALESVTILGKANSGRYCPFETEEVWGVNNVATQPEYSGVITELVFTKPGKYASPPEISFIGECIRPAKAKVTQLNPEGRVIAIEVPDRGEGYTKTPEVVVKGEGEGAEVKAVVSPLRKFHKLFAFDFLPKEYTDIMKKYAPVVSWQPYADIHYPVDEVVKEYNTRYFGNTICYMIALVGYLKIPKLYMYGVDMSFGAPYAQENRGIEYWIGRIQERGTEVINHPESHVLRTVSGVMYGEQHKHAILMYLHERINLVNILPRQGHYSDSLKAHNAWWVLFPKSDESEAHHIQVNRNPDGSMAFNCPQEFTSDVEMPAETWEYLRDILRNLEAKGELPFALISLYEKLILSQPDGGG